MVQQAHSPVPAAEQRAQESSLWPHVLDPLKHFGEKVAGYFSPAADAATTEEAYEISVELPGVRSDDIIIELHEDLLTIKGEKHFEREEKGRSYYFSERRYGAFQRAFRLPADVDASDIDASHNEGVLTVRVAKRTPASKSPSRIPVKAG